MDKASSSRRTTRWTRSRNPTYHCSLDDFSLSKRRKRVSSSIDESVLVVDEDGKEIIVIDNDNDHEDCGDEEDERLVHSGNKEVSDVIVDKGENFVRKVDNEGLEGENHVTLGEKIVGKDNEGLGVENHVMLGEKIVRKDNEGFEAEDAITVDDSDDDDVVDDVVVDDDVVDDSNDSNVDDDSNDSDSDSDSDDDDDDSGDEDFEAGNEGGDSCYSSEHSSSSDDGDYDERKKKNEKCGKVVKERLRKGKSESSEIESEDKEGGFENSPSSVNSVQSQEEVKHANNVAASVSSSTLDKKSFFGVKACSSRMNESAVKRVENVIDVDCDETDNVSFKRKRHDFRGEQREPVMGMTGEETHNNSSFKRKRHDFRGEQSEPVMRMTGDSTKVEKNKRNNVNGNGNGKDGDSVNVGSGEGKMHSVNVNGKDGDSVNVGSREGKMHNSSRSGVLRDETEGYGRVQISKSVRPKEQRLLEMLAECYLENKNSIKGNSIQAKEKNGDAVFVDPQPKDCRPKDCGMNLLWSFADKVEPLPKSKSQEELDRLHEEAEYCWNIVQAEAQIGKIDAPKSECEHDLRLDEEVGLYCRLCDKVVTEIKYMCSRVLDRYPNEGSGKRLALGGENVSPFDESQFNASGGDSDAAFSNNKGTVWDLIPDIKQSLYHHQRNGFEFIWKNLEGTIDLQNLKNADPSTEGGCIISHAPGTGKTRLTIVFLQTYMKVFPNCLPVILAPASLLSTWEDELKKWDIGVPFHNLNNPELSGQEHMECINSMDLLGSQQVNKVANRMVKLCSWSKEKSILGISYSLYERLAGKAEARKQKRNPGGEKTPASVKGNTENGLMGQILLENPGLLVLDEGHTPRNENSQIWKVLSKVQTKKRIILSGTPFQNSLGELYSTLRLVRPSFPNMIPQELKKFCQSKVRNKTKESKEWTWEPVCSGNTNGKPSDEREKINQLKSLMDPFVDVYEGRILQKDLPGLRRWVLSLKPNSLQEEILQSIDDLPNGLDSEHKLTLVSVHPSLFLQCKHQTKKEEAAVKTHEEQLIKLSLDPYGGTKTRFLIEFVQLCAAMNEKVLVFSQFIDPLEIIIAQLEYNLKWSVGKEVLQMTGHLQPKLKQFLIHTFNNEKSEAKIMLASTKACSEGISLIGASRVVLLDVVWNPSVERQAISRAYRLGQKKVVYTYRLITPTEVAKLRKQVEKDRLSKLVFSARDVEDYEPKSCAVDFEDMVLDKMVKHAKLKDIFTECVEQPMDTDLFGSPSP